MRGPLSLFIRVRTRSARLHRRRSPCGGFGITGRILFSRHPGSGRSPALPQPGTARRGAHHRPRLAHDARGEDRLHGRARVGAPPRRRRLAPHRGLPRGRAGRPEQLGPAQSDADDAVPAGLRSRRDVGPRARAGASRRRRRRRRATSSRAPRYSRSGLIVRAPNADLARDPRWGRTEEVYGEDPFLVGTLATAFTRGLQGDDPRYWKTAALLKHFLANSNEDGREQLVVGLRRAAAGASTTRGRSSGRCARAARAR